MVYYHVRSNQSSVSIGEAVLACQLKNGEVIDLYLARNQGEEMVMERLEESGLEYRVQRTQAEYR